MAVVLGDVDVVLARQLGDLCRLTVGGLAILKPERELRPLDSLCANTNQTGRQAGRQPTAFPVRDVYRSSREELHRTEREREREREAQTRPNPSAS